jgi:hypothetical protein
VTSDGFEALVLRARPGNSTPPGVNRAPVILA